MRRLKTLGVIIASGLLAAACGTSSSSSSSSGGGGGDNAIRPQRSVLTLSNEGGSLWTCNFNPYNLSSISYRTRAAVYEPLAFVRHPAERENHAVAGHELEVQQR